MQIKVLLYILKDLHSFLTFVALSNFGILPFFVVSVLLPILQKRTKSVTPVVSRCFYFYQWLNSPNPLSLLCILEAFFLFLKFSEVSLSFLFSFRFYFCPDILSAVFLTSVSRTTSVSCWVSSLLSRFSYTHWRLVIISNIAVQHHFLNF